ncbi:hypothetical protein JAAARDRAFT_261088 [Jaapia argillacea MUCL 33604]|uniref:Cytochrome P450 n=1 Tax=Jaapia argillacea MUCL 33604 TaxID=933084 RepID=A0A067PU22_9AGAM|nr:hypothetical protein JAAARDRAFT_261088 [Jaapia argillacea MUCL 33604]
MVHPIAVTVTVALTAFFLLRKWNHKRRSGGLPYPPGPKPDWFIGNLRHLPKDKPWMAYLEWGKQYGEIISYESFGTRIVVLNSARVAIDLLEKRGAIYSNRDQNNMRKEVAGGKWTLFSQMNYTDEFRQHRKIVNSAFNPTASRAYYSCQEKEAHALLPRLLNDPVNYRKHMRRATGSIILTVTYGHEVTTDDDYLVKLNEDAIRHNVQVIDPNKFIVNFISALRYLPSWMPGTEFKAFAKKCREFNKQLADIPFGIVKDQIANGTAPPSYMTKLLEENGGDEEGIIKSTASLMYAAGSDTTLMSLKTFLLAMLMFPDIQKKIQAELDAVIGTDRLPTFADYDSLPYFHFCMLETLRWKPIAPTGVPHSIQRDDVYEGMFIPAGASIIPNQWAILQDEKMYPEPKRFWPERWDGRFPDARDSRMFAFGFNRRMCPGRHLALNSFFIMAASLLTVFNIEKAKDAEGNEIPIVNDMDNNEFNTPWVPCAFTPRSPGATALIRSVE